MDARHLFKIDISKYPIKKGNLPEWVIEEREKWLKLSRWQKVKEILYSEFEPQWRDITNLWWCHIFPWTFSIFDLIDEEGFNLFIGL